MSLNGPAVVEEYGSTTVVQPGQVLQIDRFANMLLRPGSQTEDRL